MMKKTLYLTRNELYTLFYSPIAWILMILFLIMTGADYIKVTDNYMGMFERGGTNLMFTENLTSAITSDLRMGYLLGVIRNLYIFFPLITMGLISRETSSGTIKLLYSSPIRIREIVLGKFLAIICFTLCLVFLLLITLIALAMTVANVDYGQLMASLLGLFMVLSTYAAIGLFISSLTSYQIVAALITLGVFGLLSRIGDLWQDIDTIRNITYYMNIGGKSFTFIRGLMNLRDFSYFVILIATFLSFTIIRIKSATESLSVFRKAMRYMAVIAIAFLLAYITNLPQVNRYYDATRSKLYTITPSTRAMINQLNEGELEITAYANLLDYTFKRFVPAEQNTIIDNIWQPYTRFKPDIKIRFVYYYNMDSNSYSYKLNPGKSAREIAEKEVKTYRLDINDFLGPDSINRLVNTSAEDFRPFFVLKYRGKEVVLRTFDDNKFWPTENEIAASIHRLLATPPKIAFLSDETERDPFSERAKDYKAIASARSNRYALINQGYDFDTLSLSRSPIPDGLTALVIADPRMPIAPESLNKINAYLDGGGNLLMTSEPETRDITQPLFDKLGLSLREGKLIQPAKKFPADCIFTYLTDSAIHISPQFARSIHDEFRYSGDSLFRVAMAGVSALNYQEMHGFKVVPLLTTDQKLSWNRLTPISSDSLQTLVTKLPGDETGSFVTAVRMTRMVSGKEQRIIVAGDADYLSTPQLNGYAPPRYNYSFGFWCFSYFSYGQYPANTLRPESLDNAFKITAGNIPFQKLLLYWILPALIAILCSVILFRRKRK